MLWRLALVGRRPAGRPAFRSRPAHPRVRFQASAPQAAAGRGSTRHAPDRVRFLHTECVEKADPREGRCVLRGRTWACASTGFKNRAAGTCTWAAVRPARRSAADVDRSADGPRHHFFCFPGRRAGKRPQASRLPLTCRAASRSAKQPGGAQPPCSGQTRALPGGGGGEGRKLAGVFHMCNLGLERRARSAVFCSPSVFGGPGCLSATLV